MMSDKFSADLRRHLLETANERPGEGQLAAIVDLVWHTPQRPRLVARLEGIPRRIGPFPSTAVRWALIAGAILAATALALIGGGADESRSTVFEGSWTTTDPGDGSRMTLDVGAGLTPAVHFQDDRSTGGGCIADEIKVFTAEGSGRVTDSLLAITYPDGGGCGSQLVAVGPGFYAYDDATDTLTASDSVLWYRTREDGARPTPLPTIESQSTPRLDSACIDLHDGGTYQAGVGSMTLTATLPASTSWEGMAGRFLLSRYGCPDPASPVWIEAQVVTQVGPDACDRTGPALEVATAAEAAAALADQASIGGEGPFDATLGGYAGSRLELSQAAAFDASACTDGVLAPLSGVSSLAPGALLDVYIVDVEANVLAVAIHWSSASERADADLVAELDEVVASLRIEP